MAQMNVGSGSSSKKKTTGIMSVIGTPKKTTTKPKTKPKPIIKPIVKALNKKVTYKPTPMAKAKPKVVAKPAPIKSGLKNVDKMQAPAAKAKPKATAIAPTLKDFEKLQVQAAKALVKVPVTTVAKAPQNTPAGFNAFVQASTPSTTGTKTVNIGNTPVATKASTPINSSVAPTGIGVSPPISQSSPATYQPVSQTNELENPYLQAIAQLEKDKKSALSAQDVALNQGMSQMDANSFQQMQQLKQQMSHRGMADSGISADAYMRAQMGNNQNYQQAFAEGATAKSGIQAQYNDAISQNRISNFDYQSKLQQAEAENAIELQKIQSEQDKWLTQSTGRVFINGQQIMMGGKPMTTVEWEKLSETQRHNMATEAISTQKNAIDYTLGQDSNAIRRQQIAVDLQIATSKMQLDYSKLDYNYAKLESDNMQAQDKIRIMAENAQTSADKSKITALSTQLNSLTKQIGDYQKAGKKPPKTLVDQYNNVTGQLQSLAGNF